MQIYKTRYIPVGDYFIPDWTLPEEPRPIGTWGRMRRDYLKEYHPVLYSNMVLRGTLWTHLADLNEQAQQRLELLLPVGGGKHVHLPGEFLPAQAGLIQAAGGGAGQVPADQRVTGKHGEGLLGQEDLAAGLLGHLAEDLQVLL